MGEVEGEGEIDGRAGLSGDASVMQNLSTMWTDCCGKNPLLAWQYKLRYGDHTHFLQKSRQFHDNFLRLMTITDRFATCDSFVAIYSRTLVDISTNHFDILLYSTHLLIHINHMFKPTSQLHIGIRIDFFEGRIRR